MKKLRLIIFSLALTLSVGASFTYGYAQFAIGMVYADQFDDWARGLKWLHRGAERGNRFSQTMIGTYYVIFDTARTQDRLYYFESDGYAEGMKWLRLAAEQDDEQAQELLTYFEKNEDGFSRKSLDAANREG